MRPRLRVHHPLFVGFAVVVGALVAVIVPLIGAGLRTELEELHRRELEGQIELARAVVELGGGADAVARLITERIDNRVTLIGLDGVVLGDSFVEPERLNEVENHGNRPEVRGALSGEGVSFARRRSTTIGLPLLYGATRASLDGQPVILRIAMPLTDIERAVAQVQKTIALTAIVTLLLALAAAYATSRAFTRPLVALADRARRLADGDFSGRVPRERIAELDDLASVFNRLTEQLQARVSDLARERDEMQTLIDCMAEGVIALTGDARVLRLNRAACALLGVDRTPGPVPIGAVVRHERLREALEKSVTVDAQSAELEIGGRSVLLASRALDAGGAVTTLLDISEVRHLEQVRRDFVANASHELKTPLTSIRGFAETLAESEPPEPLRGQFLESIRANTLRLQRLVDDLLDLSRLESGSWAAARESIVVSKAITEAWELVASSGAARRDLTTLGDAVVVGDPEGLVQVFRNLFENSIRHTEQGGTIRVVVDSDAAAATARIEVTDDGEGIPLKALPRIFERFYRADSSRTRDAGGTGLGLSITKHLVVSMGGEIEAESSVGRGTTIRFTVPLATG